VPLQSYPKHLEIALGEVGINRKLNERYIIDSYLRPIGINKYANYCAAFVTYCLDNSNAINYRRTAVAQQFISKQSINAIDVLEKRTEIPAGTIVIWKWIGSWKGHVGFVTKKWTGATAETVEGNTSSNSTREGGNVEIKRRTINRHSSFRITHFTLVEYEQKGLVYNIRSYLINYNFVPVRLFAKRIQDDNQNTN
jgi:hypothetical protein